MKRRKYDFVLIMTCILFYFFLLRIDVVFSAVSKIIEIIRPFIIGCALAYFINPLCSAIEGLLNKHKIKQARIISVCVAMTIFIGVIASVLLLLIPQLWDSVNSFIDGLPKYIENLNALLEKARRFFRTTPFLPNLDVQNGELSQVTSHFEEFIAGISSGLFNAVVLTKDILIGLIAACYVLANTKKIKKYALAIINKIFTKEISKQRFLKKIKTLDQYFSGFFEGKIIDSFIIGIITFIFTLIFNIPYALLISVIIGITNIIPIFGPYLGGMISAVFLLLTAPATVLPFVAFIIVIQQIDGNIIGPKIIGTKTSLSTFWVLFAIVLFGGLFGVIGMIIGVPLFGFIIQVIKDDFIRNPEFPEATADFINNDENSY